MRWSACAGVLAWLAVAGGCARPQLERGADCELSAQCASPLVCRLGRCRLECRSARDCEPGLGCLRDEEGAGVCALGQDGCVRASDCPASLVCHLGRCANECAADRDCPAGARCEAVEAGGGACVDPSGVACSRHSECPEPLACAPDGRCRPQCREDRDCRDGLVCDRSGPVPVCARRADGGAPDDAALDAALDAGVDAGVDAGGCAEMPCRLRPPQCGCPAPRSCGLTTEFAVACLEPGGVPEGGYCDGMEQCGPGLACTMYESFEGVCTRFCDRVGSLACAGSVAGSVCAGIAVGGTTPILPETGLCTWGCDPLGASAECPGGLTCLYLELRAPGGGVLPATHCAWSGRVAAGGACAYHTSCDAGATCVAGTCRTLCTVGGSVGCAGAHTCTPFSTPAVVGAVEYGACLP